MTPHNPAINQDALRAAQTAFVRAANAHDATNESVTEATIEAYIASLPQAGEPVAKNPSLWDLSQVLRHAFFSGRGTKGGLSPDEDLAAWVNYNPEGSPWYNRLAQHLASPAQAPDAGKGGGEVWEWRYRSRAHTSDGGEAGPWNQWQDGRAPELRNGYETEERVLYAFPPTTDPDAARREADRAIEAACNRVRELYGQYGSYERPCLDFVLSAIRARQAP